MTDFWKNKKIIAYIALAHHTRFITPVMEFLESKGATIKYIVGQAERSQEITAIELGLKYTHIFDFVSQADQEDILQNYTELKHTFSNSLKHDFFLGMNPVTVTDKTLLSTATEHAGFKNLFKSEKPDLCFALHEINRWGKMFAFWAKKFHVPFISLQEGLLYGIDFGYSGHAQYSTINLVWGKRVKGKLINFDAPESKIFPIGNTHLAREIAYQEKENIREITRKKYQCENAYVTLLILSGSLPVPDLFFPIFKAVSENDDQRLFIKFHPACKKQQMDNWVGKIEQAHQKNCFFIHARESTYDLISAADVVVLGQKSTTGLETLALGKPLVKLDFAYNPGGPYSFVDRGVAIKMRVEELIKALIEKTDFSTYIDPKKIKKYLDHELADTSSAIETVCRVFKKIIQANKTRTNPIPLPQDGGHIKWSIVIQVPDNPDIFLAQLEAIAVNSQQSGEFEIFILVPDNATRKTTQILESLGGDVHVVHVPENQDTFEVLNQAMTAAGGEYFIFLEKNLAPLKGWLKALNLALKTQKKSKLYGGRIAGKEGKIANAGMVVDHNNAPVSAYQNLNLDYEHALKQRHFQMVDYFIAIKRNLFFKIGGFTPKAGRFRFLDACLKALETDSQPETILYLPQVQLIFLDKIPKVKELEDAIYFYARWHEHLWESESRLYKNDAVSLHHLNQARISAAMKAFRTD